MILIQTFCKNETTIFKNGIRNPKKVFNETKQKNNKKLIILII